MTPAYIFDLDGTLVDTAPDLLEALNQLMSRVGRRLIHGEELRHLVGRGARVLIERAFAETGDPVPADELEILFEEYLQLYAAQGAKKSRLYPGVAETLTALKVQGAKLAVLTNKPHDIAMAVLPDMGLDGFFSTVYGAGKRDYIKPDGRLVPEVLAEIGATGPAVMVGDSITDVQTAHNGGIPVILLPYGYSPEPVDSLGGDMVVAGFADIPAAAAKIWVATPR